MLYNNIKRSNIYCDDSSSEIFMYPGTTYYVKLNYGYFLIGVLEV